MKVIIVGGGASGVICGIKLKKLNPNFDILILEQNDRLLKKVLKTGNGKCNIANTLINESFYNDFRLLKNNINKVNVIEELKSLNIFLKNINNLVYPYSESSATVVNALIENLEKENIKYLLNTKVTKIKKENNFIVNDIYEAKYLVIATGSLSNSITNGYDLLKSMNLEITKLKPALVPLETYEKTSSLNGIRVKCMYKNKTGEILFKNNGISGILALDISRVIEEGEVIYLDLMPEYDINYLKEYLNDYTLNGIFNKMIVNEVRLRSKSESCPLYEVIKNFKFTIKKKLDFSNSQITQGGLSLDYIDENFETKVNNLYAIGEVIDVDGACGGYNLYFAWLSGLICALSINNKKIKI